MSAEILASLVAANIAASAAIVFVVLIRRTARRIMGARLAYWLWAVPVLAGFATLLPPRPEGGVTPAAPIQPIAEATVSLANSVPAVLTAHPQAGFDVALLLTGIWAAGALAFLALMLLQQRRTLRALNLAPEDDLQRARSNFGPAVVGVLRPLLVVPADFEQRFSPSEQALVLAHEREHLAAGHTRINAAQVVLTSLNWFNPLAHWAARLARADQELACDAAVMERFPRQRAAYAEALLKAQISRTPLPLGCTWPPRSSHFLIERVTMLANKTPGRARRIAGAAFIAAAMLGTGLAAWAQQSALPGSGAVYAGGTVSVGKDGRVVWNGKTVEGETLKAQARAQASSGVPNIQLSADATTPYNKVGKVIEEAQKAGMKAIKFMPSGAVLNTPMPPPPGSTIPAPPPVDSQLAIIEKAKPDPQATPKPTAPLVTPSPFPDPIRVFVDFDNSLFLNGVVVDLATLETAFRENAALKLPAEVHIEPHRLATYARVEQVIATADKAGPTKFGVIGGT